MKFPLDKGHFITDSYITGTPINQNSAWYNPTQQAQAIRETVGSEINEAIQGQKDTGKEKQSKEEQSLKDQIKAYLTFY